MKGPTGLEKDLARQRLSYLWQMLAGTVIVVLAAALIDGDRAIGPEEPIFRFVNGFPDLLRWPIWVLMQFGNTISLAILAVVSLVMIHHRLSMALALGVVGKYYFTGLIKDHIVRHRPPAVLDDVVVRDTFGAGQAFVSGHAVIAALFATLLSPYLERRWRLVLWTGVGVVCFGRVYSGAHMPLDVAAGTALGWALGAAINFLLGPPTRHGTTWAERRAGIRLPWRPRKEEAGGVTPAG